MIGDHLTGYRDDSKPVPLPPPDRGLDPGFDTDLYRLTPIVTVVFIMAAVLFILVALK